MQITSFRNDAASLRCPPRLSSALEAAVCVWCGYAIVPI